MNTVTRTRIVEYHVALADMSTIRRHRYEADYDAGVVLDIHEEWAWNYHTQSWNSSHHSHTYDVSENGTVEHNGRDLDDHASRRVERLTDARFQHYHDTVTERTEHVTEDYTCADEVTGR